MFSWMALVIKPIHSSSGKYVVFSRSVQNEGID